MTCSHDILITAKELLDQDMPEKALELLDRLTEDHTGEVLFLKGEIYYKLQRWGEALNHFSQYSNMYPDDLKSKSYCRMIQNILGFFHKDLYNP